MRYVLFGSENELDKVDTAILIKQLNSTQLVTHYVEPTELNINRFIAFNLYYSKGKVKAKDAKEYLQELLEGLVNLGVTTLYVADATYFKFLTGVKKTSDAYNEVMPCTVKGFEHMQCILGVNYNACVYDAQLHDKLNNTIKTLKEHLTGTFSRHLLEAKNPIYQPYIDNKVLKDMLTTFLKVRPELAVDIETTGLRFNGAKIESIAFSWDDSTGYAVIVDSTSMEILKDFFKKYTGNVVYHNGLFDIKFLVYHCFMKDKNDLIGMLEGIEELTKNIDDTMIMTYLCTNNTQGNELGLKPNTLEYTGNYAEDVKDITKISYEDLLTYNLRDTMATMWLKRKREKELITEGQADIYKNLFMKSFPVLLEMMLVGLPMDISRLNVVKRNLEYEVRKNKNIILKHPAVKTANFNIAIKEQTAANKKLKRKLKSISDFMSEFNINSNNQKTELFYGVLGLPIIENTDSGMPSCSGKTIKKLINHTEDESIKKLLKAFKDYMDADKILGTFIKAFEKFAFEKNGHYWLNGNHKLGGTLSGRLSSTEPNLANLPSNSKYGKDIKSIFKAPEGWLFCGSDYSALEDRVVAILSQDPNKKRIFTDNIDGHCLNAYGYYSDQMPDINPKDPESINSIADKYPKLRQESKASTFALNYAGTALTLHVNNGIPMEQAIKIEEGHKQMYAVLHNWGQSNKIEMSKQGFITGAYGLKIRTPMLAKSLIDSKITPSKVKAEFRSGNNAVTQSHGLMTTNAGVIFRERLNASKYRHDVLMLNFIHDAIYLLVREDLEVLEWVNKNLIECMVKAGDDQVRDNPEVPILAEFEIGVSWDKQYKLPVNATKEKIAKILQEKLHETS